MAYDVPELLKMSYEQLDALFSNSPAGDIPDGVAKGTAIIASGTIFSPKSRSKTFDRTKGVLRNRITVFGISAIIAKVYKGASWLDDKDCVVLDYSDTSVVAHWIRDEIRLIAPDFYLGRVYWANKPLIHFCLEFGAAAAATQGS
jgi:hypothetical protein